MSKLTQLTAEINQLAREKREAVRGAYTWNRNMSDQYNHEKKLEAETKVRAEYDPRLDALKAEAREVATSAATAGAKHRPTLDRSDTAQVANVRMEWDNRVLPLLQADKSLRSILAEGDIHTVLAAEQYAPAWFRANRPKVTDHAFISDTVTNRFAELAPDDTAAAAIRDAHNAASERAVFNDVVASAESDSSAMHLDAAVKVAYANGEVNTRPTADPMAADVGAAMAHNA
ncbi:hypothetical protein [Williamsia sp. DF01-3]|uniref:hypothetical protein n=1 Tax=Williamsia sp. DF01-3 TaxID=2934157 RepID=UPI001FF2C70C|nr:hypothetical protein [Williamsia sp. DF01-3]MCK0516974.1 hypothetical protein [Williamsia sp. DF01-3]